MQSINSRLLFIATSVLICFFGLTGFTLDRAFQQSIIAATKERLQVHIYSLIAATDLNEKGVLHIPDALPHNRFSNPSSGLYAQITRNLHQFVWRSPSSLGLNIPYSVNLKPAQNDFHKLSIGEKTEVYAMSFGISWIEKNNKEYQFTFSVAESLVGFYAQLNSFRRDLWGWLIAIAVILLAVQAIILRWGLSPLRRAAQDLEAIEGGTKNNLDGTYPKELQRLTQNINRLISNERANLKRYRNTLDDLAHSLKTPLAVMQSSVDNQKDLKTLSHAVQEQTERMSNIINYQLQRAGASGHMTYATPVAVEEVVHRIVATMNKVFGEKRLDFTIQISKNLRFQGAEGDFMELLGNLIENACKWGKHRINIDISPIFDPKSGISLSVEDDGPGIPTEKISVVLERGVRADTRVQGHGIGLAIVKDIVATYDGQITIATSQWGGAQVKILIFNK